MRTYAKDTKKKEYEEKEIKTGAYTYNGGCFCGCKKDGTGFWLALRKDDSENSDCDFLNSYEAVNFLNQLLFQFSKVDVEYYKDKSKKGTEYEVCELRDYKIAE